MTTTLELEILDIRRPPAVRFPQKCVRCGRTREVSWPVSLSTGVQRRGETVRIKMTVPMCSDCAALDRHVGNVTWLPFLIGGLLVSLVVFLFLWRSVPTGTPVQVFGFSALVAVAAALLAGLMGGSLVEFAIRLLFVPAFGELLAKRPLTVFRPFENSKYLLGFSVKFIRQKHILSLTFENDGVADKVAQLNAQEKK